MLNLGSNKNSTCKWLLSLLTVLVMLCPTMVSAQPKSKTDSLLQILPGAVNEKRADILNGLSKSYIGNDTAKAMSYYHQARELSEKLNYKKGLAASYNNIGTIYYFSSNYTSDTSYQFRALRLFEEIGDKEGIARSNANIGLALYAQSQYVKALEYHMKALKVRQELGDKEAIADSYTSIGIIYTNQGEYTSALDYQLESLKIREQLKDKKAIALSNNYLGNIYKALKYYDKALECYSRALALYEEVGERLGTAIASNNVGGIYAVRGENARALKYYNKSLEVCNSLGNRYNRIITYNYLGQVYENMGDNAVARDFFSKALIESIQIGNKASTAASYNNIGELDYKEGRYVASIQSLQNAKKIAEQASLKDELSLAYVNLSRSYAATGNYQAAYEFHSKYSYLQDTLRNVDLKRISTLTTRALESKKNKELEVAAEREKKVEAEVKKQVTIKYSFIGGSILLLVFLVILFSRFRVINSQKKIIENEQERSNSLLLNILPADVAEELKQNGKALARSYERVTVLFADIQNFTKIGEKLTPERLVSEIDYYFKAFDDIITRYGIEKIKTIGDAYMCASGLHNQATSSAVDMVHAALDLQEWVDRTRLERIEQGEIFFEVRVGIHTGPVVAGIVGSKKFAYDIWGDAVNTAARMETAGETNHINISEVTYGLVKDHFDCIHRGKMEVKNKGLMDMYFVNRVKTGEQVTTDFEGMKKYVLKELADKLPENLYYHGVHHTEDVLAVTEKLAYQEKLSTLETDMVKAAALFHDSGFITTYHDHEEASCTMARATMPLFGYSSATVEEICTLILATKMPQSPKNHLERILCDADLDYLGRDDYDGISNNLFRELKEYGYIGDDEMWRQKQELFLSNHHYFLENTAVRKNSKAQNLTKLQSPQANTNTITMSIKKSNLYLVPTDFSEVADCAVNHAAECARVTGSEVRLLHIVNKDTEKKLGLDMDQVETRLKEQVNELKSSHGIKVSYKAEEGSIFDTIGEIAETEGAQLLFMGTHGVVGLQQKLLGGFALKVISSSPVPVIVVQKKNISKNGYDIVVCPVDSTKEIKQKLSDTLALAKVFNSEVHIFEYPESDEFLQNALKRNSVYARKFLNEGGVKTVVAEADENEGDYYKQMIRYASKVNADLLVIMSESQKGIKEFIIGPEEEKIVNNDAQIAVMCVNPRDNNTITDAIVY